MVWIEVQPEPVGFGFLIAPGQLPHDPRGVAVVQPRSGIQRRIVVRQAQLGPLGGWLPFVRVALREFGGRRGAQPYFFVEPAIDHNGGVRANRLHDRYGRMDGTLPACRSGGTRDGKERERGDSEHSRSDVLQAALLTSIRQTVHGALAPLLKTNVFTIEPAEKRRQANARKRTTVGACTHSVAVFQFPECQSGCGSRGGKSSVLRRARKTEADTGRRLRDGEVWVTGAAPQNGCGQPLLNVWGYGKSTVSGPGPSVRSRPGRPD
jgi:hypothetical protein